MRLKSMAFLILISIFFTSYPQDKDKKEKKKTESDIKREQQINEIDSISTANYAKAARLDSILKSKK